MLLVTCRWESNASLFTLLVNEAVFDYFASSFIKISDVACTHKIGIYKQILKTYAIIPLDKSRLDAQDLYMNSVRHWSGYR